MPSGGSPSGSTTTVQKSDPWEKQQPYLEDIMKQAQGIFDQGTPQLYPNSFTAQKSIPSVLAEEMTLGRALGGSQLNDSARNQLQTTVNGGYLNSNPYLDKMINNTNDSVQQRVQSAFGGGGRFGSGINQEVLTRELANNEANMRGNNYNMERGYQNQAIGAAPGFAQQDYGEIGKIAAVGQQRDTYNQQLLDEAKQRFDYTQGGQGAKQSLADFSQFVQGNYGGTQTSTNPYYQNQGAGILGSALSLGSLGSQMGLFGGASAGMLGAPLGAAGSAAGLSALGAAGSAFIPHAIGAALPWATLSDENLKENIEPKGQENGHNVYRFTYKDDPDKTPYIGVMAQEILLTHPEAVSEVDGHLAVNYDAIGVKFRSAE